MASEVSKPDFSYQWSSGGSIVAPSNVKIQTGWTAEVPPFQWENWSQNRQDNAILHLFQKGISEWDAASNYYFTTSGVRSYVQGSDGHIYVAVADSLNQNPVTDTSHTYWDVAFITPSSLSTSLALSGPVAGAFKKLAINVTSTAATLTATAEEIVVGIGLTGARYKFTGFSKSINLATTGVGGIDTGTATANGFVGIYVIYNPNAATSSTNPALLATMETAAVLPTIYGGANMPSGYTASALISVAPISGTTGQFAQFYQIDKHVDYLGASVLTGSSSVVTAAARPSSAIPYSAKFVGGFNQVGSSSASAVSQILFPTASGVIGGQFNTTNVTAGSSQAVPFWVGISLPQNIYQTTTNSAGTASFTISVKSYEF